MNIDVSQPASALNFLPMIQIRTVLHTLSVPDVSAKLYLPRGEDDMCLKSLHGALWRLACRWAVLLFSAIRPQRCVSCM